MLESLGLPAALDALDRPIGLPPSIIRKAEEVRREDGIARIDSMIRNVETLATHNMRVIDDVRTACSRHADLP